MRAGKILKAIAKNILAFFGGAVLGVITVIILFLPHAVEKVGQSKEPLAIIALLPVFLILYGFFGVIAGGFLGVVGYNVVKIIRKRKNSRRS